MLFSIAQPTGPKSYKPATPKTDLRRFIKINRNFTKIGKTHIYRSLVYRSYRHIDIFVCGTLFNEMKLFQTTVIKLASKSSFT